MLLDLSLPSVPPAARPVSGVTERVTNPGWHRVPSQCHRPRSVPAIHPRATSPGDSRSAAAGGSQPRLCLELTGFHLPRTPLLGKKLSFLELKKWPLSGWAQGMEGRFCLFLRCNIRKDLLCAQKTAPGIY